MTSPEPLTADELIELRRLHVVNHPSCVEAECTHAAVLATIDARDATIAALKGELADAQGREMGAISALARVSETLLQAEARETTLREALEQIASKSGYITQKWTGLDRGMYHSPEAAMREIARRALSGEGSNQT